MFDAVACCRIRTAGSSVVTLESLRELRTVLRCTQRSDLELAIQDRHRYLLKAGGADVGVADSTEIHSTGVVRPAASQAGLARTVARDATEDTAPDDGTAAASSKVGRFRDRRRGAMSEKIKPYHVERKAILYVRQSSAYQ